jgi:hypothetical protein
MIEYFHCKQSLGFSLIFRVFTAASMKIAVFLVVAPCSLVEVYRRFRGACCLHHEGCNVGKLLPDYTAQQPGRQPSSDSVCFAVIKDYRWEAQTHIRSFDRFWRYALSNRLHHHQIINDYYKMSRVLCVYWITRFYSTEAEGYVGLISRYQFLWCA